MRNIRIQLIALSLVFSLSFCSADEIKIATVDFVKLVEASKIGKELKCRLKKLMDDIRKKISKLENGLKNIDSIPKNKQTYNAIFKSDFDVDAYVKSSDKDKHLMLYSLVQQLSNEVSVAASNGEQRLKDLITETVEQVAKLKSIDVVIDKTAIAYSNWKLRDITNDVIKSLDQKCCNFKYPEKLRCIDGK